VYLITFGFTNGASKKKRVEESGFSVMSSTYVRDLAIIEKTKSPVMKIIETIVLEMISLISLI
jgi:hypothetical protein